LGARSRLLRAALFGGTGFYPILYCHRPVIVRDERAVLGEVIPKLIVQPERLGDDVIDKDTIIFWGTQKRIITGSDILGRLMRGIVENQVRTLKKGF
jgi:metal transporter CNNM